MPAAIPLLVQAGLTAFTTYAATTIAAATFASSLVVGFYQQRQNERRARAAMANNARDRTTVIRVSDEPHRIVYGRQRVGGVLAFAHSHGTAREFLSLVVVCASHEIDGFEEVWIGQDRILVSSLDGSGFVTSGRYAKQIDNIQIATADASAGSLTIPAPNPTVVSVTVSEGDSGSQTVSFTQSGSVVSWSGIPTGTITVNYRTTTPRPLVQFRFYTGSPNQTADSALIAAAPGRWTSAHRLRGRAYFVATLRYDPDVFTSGIPDFSVVVRGKRVSDPRSGQTVFSRNPALQTRDYLLSSQGFGALAQEIDSSVVGAANICDEQVAINGSGATQSRYVGDVVLSAESQLIPNLEALLAPMAGMACFQRGAWTIQAGAYSNPVMDLFEDDFSNGDISVTTKAARKDLFNAVRGRFVSPAKNWQDDDFPPYRSSFYQAQDANEQIERSIDFPGITDSLQAQRLAKLALFRSRQAASIEATFKLKAWPLMVGDFVRLSVARYGWNQKVFRVLSRQFVAEGRIKLTLREEAPDIYSWTFNEATVYDPAPDSLLPTPWVVAAPSSLTVQTGSSFALIGADGSREPFARLSWPLSSDSSVREGGAVEIEYKLAQAATFIAFELRGSETETRVQGIRPEEVYVVRARFRNGVGTRSNWTYSTHVVAGTTPAELASDASRSWPSIIGPNRPEDLATRSRVFRQSTAPASPNPNDVWDRLNGEVYTWDGFAWQLASTVGANSSNLRVGVSSNRIANSGLYNDRNGWGWFSNDPNVSNVWDGNDSASESGGVRFGRVSRWPWDLSAYRTPPEDALAIYQGNNRQGFVYDANTFFSQMPVEPGQRWEVQAELQALRCACAINVSWSDATGNYVGETQVASISEVYAYQRVGGFVTVPAGVRRAIFFFRKQATTLGQADSWLFGRRAMMSPAFPNQTQLSAYVEGPPRGAFSTVDQITPATASTYIANLAVNTLQIADNAVTIPIITAGQLISTVTTTPQAGWIATMPASGVGQIGVMAVVDFFTDDAPAGEQFTAQLFISDPRFGTVVLDEHSSLGIRNPATGQANIRITLIGQHPAFSSALQFQVRVLRSSNTGTVLFLGARIRLEGIMK